MPASRIKHSIKCDVFDGDSVELVRHLAPGTRIFAPEKYDLMYPARSKVFYSAYVTKHDTKLLPHAVIIDAHRASLAWARPILAKHGRVLKWISGDSRALSVRDSLLQHVCARKDAIPRCALKVHACATRVDSLSQATALVKQLGVQHRIIAPNVQTQKQTMEHLRGSASAVRHGDPVWLWRSRARDYACSDIDFAAAPKGMLRLQRAGYIRTAELNVALVDTPTSVGALRLPVAIVLVGLSRPLQAAVFRSTTSLVIGVGFCPALV